MNYKKAADIIQELMAEYHNNMGVPLDDQTAFGLLGYVVHRIPHPADSADGGIADACPECGEMYGHTYDCPRR